MEVERFLAQAAFGDAPVALGHLHLAKPLAPVQQWNLKTYLYQLVAAHPRIRVREFAVSARDAHLGIQIYLAHVALGLGHLVVRLKLTAAYVLRELIVV